MRKLLWVSIAALLLIQTAASQATNGSTNTTLNITAPSEPGNATIEAGKVVDINVSSPNAFSRYWAGVYGNVTTDYVVGQQETPFYSWDLVTASYVYAASGPLDLTGEWAPRNLIDMESQYAFLSNATGTESPGKTFNRTEDIVSDLQDDPVNDTIAAHTYNQTGDPYWKTMYLGDGSNGFFAAEVTEGRAFNNKKANYQMILPEDGYDGGQGTAFDIYVELE